MKMLIKSSIVHRGIVSVAMHKNRYAKMTTNIESSQVMWGNGPPVAIAPNNTFYIDSTTNTLYISQGGSWFAAGAGATKQLVLTSAQILALHTTPINIIPAPLSTQLIVVDTVTYKGTGAYTNAGGSGLVYHGTSVAADESFAAPANPWINGTTLSGTVQTNVNMTTAIGLGVDVSGVAADPTVGTTPATVTVNYHVMTP